MKYLQPYTLTPEALREAVAPYVGHSADTPPELPAGLCHPEDLDGRDLARRTADEMWEAAHDHPMLTAARIRVRRLEAAYDAHERVAR